MAEVVLKVDHLSRQVGGLYVVQDISIEVLRGEVLAVVGPSGSGKSSFLRLLNRLDEATAGAVFLEGRDCRRIPPAELRRAIGMVMQLPNLFPGSVADNIRYGPRQRGETFPDEDLAYLLDHVGLTAFADRAVAQLSVGEAQRVSLARTLANAPQVLLLDEPTSALDDAARDETERLIFDVVRRRGLTCLIVTHDKDQARRVADRAMLLEKGRLLRVGPVSEVLDA